MSHKLIAAKDRVLSFKGPVVAAITPFFDGHVNLKAVPAYIEQLVNNEVNGFYVHGTTGEGVSMNHQEKMELTKTWAQNVKQLEQLFIVNVTSCSVQDMVEHAKLCQSLAVDAIAVLPPFYHRPSDVEQLTSYMKTIGDAAPDIPLMYYHFPLMTKVDLPLTLFLDSVLKSVPNFVGLKFTSKDIVDLNSIHSQFGDRIKIFPGYEETLLGAFALGLDSSVCAQFNFRSGVKDFNDIVQGLATNDLEGARSAQLRMVTRSDQLQRGGTFVENVKTKLEQETGLTIGKPIPPVYYPH